MIQIKNLVKRYGDTLALDYLNLDVKEGEIFGFLGPNGSGKTTAINCMLALLKYDRGEIKIMGKEMTPVSYDIKSQIGIVPQDMAVFDELTVYENVDYFCGLYVTDKKLRKKLVKEALEFVSIEEYSKKKPKKLSGGLKRRLNIACGIAHKPKILILDEPTVAVDPQSRNNILEGIVKLNKEGTTVIYTSHYMEEVEQICSRIAIMDHGRVIASGTKEELKNMIKTGITVTVSNVVLSGENIEDIKKLPEAFEAVYFNDELKVKFEKDEGSTIAVLKYLEDKKIGFGNVISTLPTLNDVFLEITGKDLRD